jgi:serine/threonine protein kinase
VRHRRRRLRTEQALGIVRDVLSGLEHIHERRLVHGHLKPENVLCTPNGLTKVCDVGLAQAHGAHADIRSDLHACGLILYEVLTRRPPDETKALSAPPNLPHIPDAVAELVVRALALDPQDRFQTTAEMRHRLDEAAAEVCGEGWEQRSTIVAAVGAAIVAGAPSAATFQAVLGAANTAGEVLSLPDFVGGMTTGGTTVPSTLPAISPSTSLPAPPSSVPAQPMAAQAPAKSMASPTGGGPAHPTAHSSTSSGSGTLPPTAHDTPSASTPHSNDTHRHHRHHDDRHLSRGRRPQLPRHHVGPGVTPAVKGVALLAALGATTGLLITSKVTRSSGVPAAITQITDATPSPYAPQSSPPGTDTPSPAESPATSVNMPSPSPLPPGGSSNGHNNSGAGNPGVTNMASTVSGAPDPVQVSPGGTSPGGTTSTSSTSTTRTSISSTHTHQQHSSTTFSSTPTREQRRNTSTTSRCIVSGNPCYY